MVAKKRVCRMLAAACTDGGFAAFTVIAVLAGMVFSMLYRVWSVGQCIGLILPMVPGLSMVIARRLNHHKCPLPQWRRKLLKMAA